MAKVVLSPIGDDRQRLLSDELWSGQLARMGHLARELVARREQVRDGWGEEYRARVRAKGKRTSWERAAWKFRAAWASAFAMGREICCAWTSPSLTRCSKKPLSSACR